MILYINACARENSRTDYLAKKLLNKLGSYKEIKLYEENIKPLDGYMLEFRTNKAINNDFSDDYFNYAKDFMEADVIVISAPFWDLSFPSILKVYLENIYIIGLNTKYNEENIPVGLCKAKKLYYVTTAGGKLIEKYGYEYVRDLAVIPFGIKEVELIKAEWLDLLGNDPNKILEEAIKKYNL